jgi:hypothetical protein
MRSEVITVMNIKAEVCWDMTRDRPVELGQWSGITYYFLLSVNLEVIHGLICECVMYTATVLEL